MTPARPPGERVQGEGREHSLRFQGGRWALSPLPLPFLVLTPAGDGSDSVGAAVELEEVTMRTLNEDYPLFPVAEIESIQDLLQHSGDRFADKLALEDLAATPIPRLTYRQLYEHAVRFGRALARLHLLPGEHVAIIGENRVQWTLAYLTCHAFGYVIVPIDKSLQENEVLTVLHASDAKAVIFSEHYRDSVLTLAGAVKGLKVFIDMDLPTADGRVHSMTEMIAAETAPVGSDPFPKVDPDAMAVIVFTSGAMGRAKGVMLSQRNLAANLRGMLSMILLLPEDRFLSVLPIHHTYECTCGQLCPLLSGCSIHYARSLKTVLEDLQRVKATILLGVPLLYEKMYRRITAGMAEKKLVAKLLPTLRAAARAGEAIGLQGLRKTHLQAGPRALRRRGADLHRRRGRARPAGGARAALPGVHLHPGLRPHRDLPDRRAQPAAQVPGRRRGSAVVQPRGADRRARRRRCGGDRGARPVGDDRATTRTTRRPGRCCVTAGSTPATWGGWMPTASCTSAAARRTSSSPPTARTSSPRSSRTRSTASPTCRSRWCTPHASRTATRASASSSSPTARSC